MRLENKIWIISVLFALVICYCHCKIISAYIFSQPIVFYMGHVECTQTRVIYSKCSHGFSSFNIIVLVGMLCSPFQFPWKHNCSIQYSLSSYFQGHIKCVIFQRLSIQVLCQFHLWFFSTVKFVYMYISFSFNCMLCLSIALLQDIFALLVKSIKIKCELKCHSWCQQQIH